MAKEKKGFWIGDILLGWGFVFGVVGIALTFIFMVMPLQSQLAECERIADYRYQYYLAWMEECKEKLQQQPPTPECLEWEYVVVMPAGFPKKLCKCLSDQPCALDYEEAVE
jgi:hypothetical protein